MAFHAGGRCRYRDEAAEIYTRLGRLLLAYFHTTEFEAWQPTFGEGASLAALAKRYGRLPVLANGSLDQPARVAELIEAHEVDSVTPGRGALTHANWPQGVARGAPLGEFDRRMLSPLADLGNADRVSAMA